MNRLTGDKFFVALFLLFLAAMCCGIVIFALGMRDTTYLINDGVGYAVQYLNKPRYDSHLQGFVFALTFFIAGLLLTAVILMPSQGQALASQMMGPPQPRQRQPRPLAGPVTVPAAAQPMPAAPAAPGAVLTPAPLEAAVSETAPAPAAPAAPAQPTRSVEEEVLAQNPDDLPPLVREDDSRFEDTGEDDVVYGTGRVTDDSLWDFIQRHPDSAVKFLYRKTLDNKPLSTADEDIYRRWEQRGMARSSIREIVLDIMNWKALPDDFPHNIWRELRDQIFEMRVR